RVIRQGSTLALGYDLLDGAGFRLVNSQDDPRLAAPMRFGVFLDGQADRTSTSVTFDDLVVRADAFSTDAMPCGAMLVEDFNDNTLDSRLVSSADSGYQAVAINQGLLLQKLPNTTTKGTAKVTSTFQLLGDFSVTVHVASHDTDGDMGVSLDAGGNTGGAI